MNRTRLDDIEAQLLQHQAQLNQIPSRWPQAPAAPRMLAALIIGGNTLSSGGAGIKFKASGAFTDIDAAIDPHANPTLQDGLGYGYLYRSGSGAALEDDGVGGLRQVRVLIANRWASSLISKSLVVGTWIWLADRVVLPGAAEAVAYGVGL